MRFAVYRNTSHEEVWAYSDTVEADHPISAIQALAKDMPDHLIERSFMAVPEGEQSFARVRRERRTTVATEALLDRAVEVRRRERG